MDEDRQMSLELSRGYRNIYNLKNTRNSDDKDFTSHVESSRSWLKKRTLPQR